MNQSQLIAEVIDLRDHLYISPQKYVRRWSSEECDSQIPIIRIISLLSAGEGELKQKPSHESRAVQDIVSLSPLRELLIGESDGLLIKYNPCASRDLRQAIAGYLSSRASVIGDYQPKSDSPDLADTMGI